MEHGDVGEYIDLNNHLFKWLPISVIPAMLLCFTQLTMCSDEGGFTEKPAWKLSRRCRVRQGCI